MRILFDYRPALRQRTGVGEYVHELTQALAAAPAPGQDLSIFSASWKHRVTPGAVSVPAIDRRIPVRMLNFLWHQWEWPPVETLTGRRFDVVHSTHPLLMPSRTAAQVITIYDLDFLDHPDRTRAEIRRDYPPLAAAHARRADHIVVISRHTGEEVTRRFGVPESKISICFPGAPSWTARTQEPDDGTVLFLGTLEPRKNLTVLLDAYERLLAGGGAIPPLVLAGRPTAESAEWEARARRPPLAGHVELPGYVDPADRAALFARAAVFVLPSHTEGFGMPAVEAMVMGVPVIAANRGAIPEAVGSAGRLFDPDDPNALAAALAEVLSSPDTRARMRAAGLAQARQFQWAEAARGVQRAWTLAIEHRQARRG